MALNYVVENDVFEDGVDFDTEEETLRYFGGLLCRDDGERAQFVENFGRAVKSWMSKTDDIIAQRLLEVHLPTALRLSLNSPYKDVRTKMKKLLEEVQVRYKFCVTLFLRLYQCYLYVAGSLPRDGRLHSASSGTIPAPRAQCCPFQAIRY